MSDRRFAKFKIGDLVEHEGKIAKVIVYCSDGMALIVFRGTTTTKPVHEDTLKHYLEPKT